MNDLSVLDRNTIKKVSILSMRIQNHFHVHQVVKMEMLIMKNLSQY